MSEVPPEITVVVPTFNRRDRLERVLTALGNQTIEPHRYEVVVVSDGSTDGTDDLLAGWQARHAFVATMQENAGPGAARNRGVELGRGEFVLFVDDDVVATPVLVEEHLRTHRARPRSVVIGPMATPSDHAMRPWVAWEQAMLYKQYDALETGRYTASFRQFYTGNASAPRATLLEVGGFDTRFRRAEDVELAWRLEQAGLTFTFNTAAIGHHYADRPFASWLSTAYHYGVNEIVFSRDHGQDEEFGRLVGEYRGRHRLIRALVRAFLVLPPLQRPISSVLRVTALAADRAGLAKVGRFALSALFNLTYYKGMASALGGRKEFVRSVAGPARHGRTGT